MKKSKQKILFTLMMILGFSILSWADELVLNKKIATKDSSVKYFNKPDTKCCLMKHESFSGLLIGLLLDYKQTSDPVKEVFIGTGGIFNAATGQETKATLSGKAISGGVDLGYGYQYLCSYFGVNLNVRIHDLRDRLTINNGTNYDGTNNILKINRNYTIDTSVRYGGVFRNMMPYLKVGISFSKWHIVSNFPSLATLAAIGINQFHHETKNKFGLLMGAGVDWKLSQHLLFGTYVTYTQFDTLKYTHTLLANYKITPSDLSVGIKISYLC